MSRLHMRKQGSHTLLGGTFLQNVARDEAGNVLPLTAAALVVLMALVGGAVDMTGAYKVERRLQAACDAGVLAGRRAVSTNGFDQTVQDQAKVYFRNNFDETGQESSTTVFTPTSPDNGSTITATATTKAKAVIMKVFGYQTMNLSVNCSASMGIGNSDVTFVLDTTGSMAYNVNNGNVTSTKPSKISSLRTSMKNFYTTVKNSTGTSNARVRYGFVPYSSSVNVGKILYDTNPSYLSDTVTIQSYKFVNWSGIVRTWTGSSTTDPTYGNWNYVNTNQNYTSLTNCNSAKPADTAWSNSGSPYNDPSVSVDPDNGQQVTAAGTQQDQTQRSYQCYLYSGNNRYYVIYRDATRTQASYNYSARDEIPVTTALTAYANAVYQQRTFDTSAYKAFQTVTLPIANANGMLSNTNTNTGAGTTKNQSFLWNGCVEERQTVAADSFSFDSLSTGITPSGAYDLDIDMVPTSDDTTKWKAMWPEMPYYRSAYNVKYSLSGTDTSPACPTAAKLLTEISQSDFNNYADSLQPNGGTYHDIGLIWGARFSSTTGIFASNVNSKPTNGGSVSRHLIFMTDGDLDPDPSTYSSYGVERQDHRVTPNGTDAEQVVRHRSRFLAVCEAIKARGIRLWVIAFGTSLNSDLSTCATTGSAFQADDATELDAQFQEIAKQVGELRITQ